MRMPRRRQEWPTTPPRRRRPVSISDLPRLSRPSTLDIELHYLKLHAQHGARTAKKALRALWAKVPRWLRLALGMPPALLLTLFQICADVVREKMGGVFDPGHGGRERDVGDEIWLPFEGEGVGKDLDEGEGEDEDDGHGADLR